METKLKDLTNHFKEAGSSDSDISKYGAIKNIKKLIADKKTSNNKQESNIGKYTITTYEKGGEKNKSHAMTKEEVIAWKKKNPKAVMSFFKYVDETHLDETNEFN